jgi:hypothetical protein
MGFVIVSTFVVSGFALARDVYALADTMPDIAHEKITELGHETFVEQRNLVEFNESGVSYFVDPQLYRKDYFSTYIEFYQFIAEQNSSTGEVQLNEFGYSYLEQLIPGHSNFETALTAVVPSIVLRFSYDGDSFAIPHAQRVLNLGEESGIRERVRQNPAKLQEGPIEFAPPVGVVAEARGSALALTIFSPDRRDHFERVEDHRNVADFIIDEELRLLEELNRARTALINLDNSDLIGTLSSLQVGTLEELRALQSEYDTSFESYIKSLLRVKGHPTDESSLARFWSNATVKSVKMRPFLKVGLEKANGKASVLSIVLP